MTTSWEFIVLGSVVAFYVLYGLLRIYFKLVEDARARRIAWSHWEPNPSQEPRPNIRLVRGR